MMIGKELSKCKGLFGKISQTAALVLLLAAFVCTGCGSQNTPQDEAGEASSEIHDKPQIGIIFDSFVIERWERDRDIFSASVRELGADVIVASANGDVEEQISLFNRFVENRMDAIVIIATDGSKLKPCVEKAHRVGIPVISYDRLVTNAGTDLFISFDNEKVGEYMAQAINEALPEGGNYIKINGPAEDYNVTMVNQGFDAVIHDNIKLVASEQCPGWKDEYAFHYLTGKTALLQSVGAIMCGNDSLASQAIRALAESRLAGQTVVTGQDADLEACQHIVEGTQTMTVYKPIEQLGKKAAECAVKLAKGENIESDQTINDGTSEIPYIAIQPLRVTRDNMDSVIIDSGFHMRDDVYLHISD